MWCSRTFFFSNFYFLSLTSFSQILPDIPDIANFVIRDPTTRYIHHSVPKLMDVCIAIPTPPAPRSHHIPCSSNSNFRIWKTKASVPDEPVDRVAEVIRQTVQDAFLIGMLRRRASAGLRSRLLMMNDGWCFWVATWKYYCSFKLS